MTLNHEEKISKSFLKSFILICAALFLGLVAFVRLASFDMRGASYYEENEIIRASNVELGDSLLLLNKKAIENNIKNELIYIEDVEINIKLPNKLLINVIESKAVGRISFEDELYLIDKSCRMLEKWRVNDENSYISIKGIEFEKTTFGYEIIPKEEDVMKLKSLKELLKELVAFDMASAISNIDMSSLGKVELIYKERFYVELDYLDNMEYKLSFLKNAVSNIEDEENGSFKLSFSKSNSLNFVPYT